MESRDFLFREVELVSLVSPECENLRAMLVDFFVEQFHRVVLALDAGQLDERFF